MRLALVPGTIFILSTLLGFSASSVSVGDDILFSSVADDTSTSLFSSVGDDGSASLSSSTSGANATASDSVSPISKDESEKTSTEPSSSNVSSILGIGGGVLAVGIVALVFVSYRRRRKRSAEDTDQSRGEYRNPKTPPTNQQSTANNTGSSNSGPQGQSGLWTDDVITAKRITRRHVKIEQLLSRGAFGEVYAGVYNDERVAVKLLTPETRGIISHVNNFLAEAKMTASMDHPRIVHFIGVAWDSLSDLCVVMEYMEGGDLRTLLAGYEAAKHPVGIDREKATIALHVCHALTYLHSLSPPIIHRDLKSRNILLNHALEAKLIDFGISRERLDQTMTAGVGTSLWMAPEVMLGEKYDDKADMFSFGVVLSELDTHTLPYAASKDKNRDSNGRRLPDAIVLQQVAMGRLSVDFSEESPRSIADLGRACVSVDSALRPTAAEALYKLHSAVSQELA